MAAAAAAAGPSEAAAPCLVHRRKVTTYGGGPNKTSVGQQLFISLKFGRFLGTIVPGFITIQHKKLESKVLPPQYSNY